MANRPNVELVALAKRDITLVDRAKRLLEQSRSGISSVSSVLRTKKNSIFHGVNADLEMAPCSICAEYVGIETMVSSGGKEIETIVAVSMKKRIPRVASLRKV